MSGVRVEKIVFNGITFRRYPDSESRTDRVYYRPSTLNYRNGIGYLHQEIWKSVNGPIPDGHHIHHLDGDSGHNEISNLACVVAHDHLSKHQLGVSFPAKTAHLASIKPLLVAWHKSESGKAWHKFYAKENWIHRGFRTLTCEICGSSFETRDARSETRFCSDNCRAANRRRTGADNETRICAWCGKEFTCGKYFKNTCCSKSCGCLFSHARRKEARLRSTDDDAHTVM